MQQHEFYQNMKSIAVDLDALRTGGPACPNKKLCD